MPLHYQGKTEELSQSSLGCLSAENLQDAMPHATPSLAYMSTQWQHWPHKLQYLWQSLCGIFFLAPLEQTAKPIANPDTIL